MNNNLFYTIMEAEGDMLQPFDDGGDDMGVENVPDETPTQSVPDDIPDDGNPPDLSGDEQPLSYDDDTVDETPNDEDDMIPTDEPNKEDGKLSDKANNILNQKLYQQMLTRNSSIEDIIENVHILTPLLPYEVVKRNDSSVNRIKNALGEGQKYLINKFVNCKYGENLLFFQKLDTLYTLLLNEIDDNLKKIKK